MKPNTRFVSGRELKHLLVLLDEQFECGTSWADDFFWLMSDKDNLYLIFKDVEKINFSQLRINSFGLYFGEYRHNELRLSIEGSQIIGKLAKKNIVELTKDQLKTWFKGNDVDIEIDCKGFVILKNNDDFVGCGRVKENKILNFVPKARRLSEVY